MTSAARADWKKRLTETLEPLLAETDPRPHISAYHDMPYAIFQYEPEYELQMRQEIHQLETRLNNVGKHVHQISLAECLHQALEAEGLDARALEEAERSVGLAATVDTVHQVLFEYQPLDEIVAGRIGEDAEPLRDVILICRAGCLFPFYRTSSLLEQLMGKVEVPAILFYPGLLEGPAGLKFMGVLDAEHNYRPKIF